MNLLLQEIRRQPLLWLLRMVPVVFVVQRAKPEAHTLLFLLSVLAIVPLAVLLSHATESVAAKTGDAAGGLLNATLGNLTELVIALTALKSGRVRTRKSVHRRGDRNEHAFHARCVVPVGWPEVPFPGIQSGQRTHSSRVLFLATVGLLVPSAISHVNFRGARGYSQASSALAYRSCSFPPMLLACFSRLKLTRSYSRVQNIGMFTRNIGRCQWRSQSLSW